MKRFILFASLCTLALAQNALTQNKPQDRVMERKPVKASTTPGSSTSSNAPLSSASYESFSNVAIPAGQSVNLDSTLDYSSSDTVRVTIRSSNPDLLHLIGTAYFTVPNATEFVTQEVMLGTDFNYSNSGGTTFQVCGSQFRLALQNTGTSTMTLSTIVIYTHVL